MKFCWLLLGLSFAIIPAGAEECGIYLAESTTSASDDPKWGLYAGTDIPKGVIIGDPDVAIQTFNLAGNNREKDGDDDDYHFRIVEFFEQYIWVPDSSAGRFELGRGRTVTAIPGAGVLGGYNSKLTNADWDHSSAFFRPAVGEQRNVAHPGRGGYSNFFNVGLKSLQIISAGSEIFLDYGENWAEEEEEDDESEELTKSDYEKVDIVIDQIIEFMAKHEQELTVASKAEIYDFLIKDVMGAAAGSKKGRKISSMLPTDPDDLHFVKENGGLLEYSSPSAKRPADWLKTNGRCMDNIKMSSSTIPNAGRGAFARRAIPKGGLVSPLPLVQIPDKDVLNMYKLVRGSEKEKRKKYYRLDDEVVGTQLLINYCFGHPESSLLFFPSGSVAGFINHSKEKANARLVWSKHMLHRSEWFDIPPEELILEENQYIGLLMEVVALRDIEPEEEIFLDYGASWQAAWEKHEKEWQEKLEDGSVPNPWPTRALDLNDEFEKKPHMTADELALNPRPNNVHQMCFLYMDKDDDSNLRMWAEPKKGFAISSEYLRPCRVVERIELEEESLWQGPAFNYTIEWENRDEEDIVFEQVPHKAITLLDASGTSDQFFQGGFRHYIGIPDDIFPAGPWRNLG